MLFWIVQTWCVIGVLMLVLVLLTRSRKLSTAMLHALWVVVLLKSLTPPVVEWPYSIPFGSSSSEVAFESSQPSSTLSSAPMPASPLILNEIVVGDPLSPNSFAPNSFASASVAAPSAVVKTQTDFPAAQHGQAASTVARSWLNWQSVLRSLVVIWVLGSCVTLAVELFRIHKLHRVLHTGDTDVVIASEMDAVAKQLGIATIPHRVVRGVSTPLIWSCGAPVLIWPAALCNLTTEARRGLIAHELAHVKRRDHWIAWLELASKVLWWWNPLQVVLRRNLREAADQACDAYVVNSLAVPRRLYAETLLSICETQSRSASPLASLAAMQNDKRGLEIRLRNLMSKTKNYQLSKLAIATTLILSAALLPGWSLQSVASPRPNADSKDKKQNTVAAEKKKQAEWRLVPMDVKQEELPKGWAIPEMYVDIAGGAHDTISASGIVEDEMQRPVSGAIVMLSVFDWTYGIARTNAAGQFSMEAIPLPSRTLTQHAAVQLKAIHPQLGYGDVTHHNTDMSRTDRTTLALNKQKIRLDKFNEVHGTVVTPFGKPVAGADIAIAMGVSDRLSQYRAKPEIGAIARSDAQGKFTIKSVPPTQTPTVQRLVQLDVRHRDWPRLLVNIEDANRPIVCKFNEGIRLIGRVQFPTEAQNSEAVISVFGTNFGQHLGSDTIIDFQVDRRLIGKPIVVACFAKSDNQKYAYYHTQLEVREFGNELAFNLQPSRNIRGVVKSQDEKPIVLHAIRWKNKDETSRVGEEFEAPYYDANFQVIGNSVKVGVGNIMAQALGEFEFDVPQGEGTLLITYSLQAETQQKGLLPFPGKQREHSVAIDAGKADLPLDIVVPAVPPTEFIVRDTKGELINSGNLTLAWIEPRTAWMIDGNNSFTSQSIPHSHTIRIVNGQATATLPEIGWIGVLVESDTKKYGWTTIAESPKSPIEIVVEKPAGWVTGRAVVDSQPAANVPIHLMLNVHRSQAVLVALPPLATTTDAMGEFRLPNIAPLSGYIFPSIPDGMLREGRGVEVNLNPGQSLRVNDIRFLRPQGSVAGQVVTPDGKPVAGVEVHIRRGDFMSPLNDGLFWAKDIAPVGPVEPKLGPNGWPALLHRNDIACAAVSDADGKFEIPNLPKGSVNLYGMRITNAGPEIPVQNVMVEVGKQDVKLVCSPPAPVADWQSPAISPPGTYFPIQGGIGPRLPTPE